MAVSLRKSRSTVLLAPLISISALMIVPHGAGARTKGITGADAGAMPERNARSVPEAEKHVISGREKRLSEVCVAPGIKEEDCNLAALKTARRAGEDQGLFRGYLTEGLTDILDSLE